MEASNILSCGLEAGEAVMKSKNGDVFWALTAALFSSAWKLSAVIAPVYRWESGGPEPALWVSSQHMAGSRNSGVVILLQPELHPEVGGLAAPSCSAA